MSTVRDQLTNLLPRSAKRALRRQYFVRLVTVALGLGVFVIAVHAALLVPTYLYAHAEAARQQAELDRIAESVSSAEEKEVKNRIASVQSDIEYLGRLSALPTASGAIHAILLVPHGGIRLSGFTYAGPDGTAAAAKMTVSGTASTRDALRQYVDSLSSLPYVSSADLPISAYAKDSAIPFTITLTGSLMP